MPLAYWIFSFLIFGSTSAWAYPQFIGYKYASCLTCHFNGQGNGPLNDYGRALWAGEIAGRMFAFGRSDEKLGEASGFLGSKQMPWWVRPGFKTRYLAYQLNPPGGKTDFIIMQAEANAAFFLDKDQKYAFVTSFGYAPVPRRYNNKPGAKPDTWISREHYFRWQTTQDLWTYIGMTDRVYGIRHANHEAYSRKKTSIAQNDQTHGVILHYIKPEWEFTFHAFLGNLLQDADLQFKGFSLLYEKEVMQAWRLGFTALTGSNQYLKSNRYGFVNRFGMGFGSALMLEAGILEDTPKGIAGKRGYYIYTEAIQRLTRGYHLFVVAQSWKDVLQGDRPDEFKTGFGFLMFPMGRVEFRIELESKQQLTSTTDTPKDSWALLSQLHLSL